MKESNKAFLEVMSHPKIMFFFLVVALLNTIGHLIGSVDSKNTFLLWLPFFMSLMTWRISEVKPEQ